MITTNCAGLVFAVAAAASLAFVARTAGAEDYFSPTDERVRVSLGAIYVSSATTARVDSSSGVPGTQINGEDQFGLPKSAFEPKFEVMVRADVRHRLSFDYFTLDRSGSTTARTEIIFRNVVFLPGDPLQTQSSLRMLGLTYGYSFWHSEALEIAGTLGVHATDVSTMAKVETQSRHIIQTEDQAGPVPTVGIDATWVASRRFYFDARAQYLDVHVQNVSGSLGIYEFDALYRYRPNVSFALGYTDLNAHIVSTRPGEGGLFTFNSRGPEMFVRIAF